MDQIVFAVMSVFCALLRYGGGSVLVSVVYSYVVVECFVDSILHVFGLHVSQLCPVRSIKRTQ